MSTKKYNPGFLTDDELVASFCVRTSEFDSITETLRESTGNANQHLIVIGPRGSGKTSLLLRIAIEIRRNSELSSRLFPITFAEESYQVSTCGEFWLECLSRLAEQAPQPERRIDLRRTCEDLHTIQDDQLLAERCLCALLDFSADVGKRLVLTVENLNMMFKDIADQDAGWRLRKTFQTEPRIILLGSATSRFEQIDRPDQALYDLFRRITLCPLCTRECRVLWKAVSGECPPDGRMRSLQILTGGSPRLISIVAHFGAGHSFHELMVDLLNLIDDHTEYFKSHLDSLPAQERRVYLTLADLWKPATTKEIAERARLNTSTCSAQLKRLINHGVVSEAGGTARRKQYYLVERMYNIYYLLRRRGTDRVVEALIRFMTVFYSRSELKEFSDQIVEEARSAEESRREFYRATLMQMSQRPELAEYHDVYHKSISQLSGVAMRFGANNSSEGVEQAQALVYKGITLGQLNRSEEALGIYDEVVRRFGASDSSEIIKLVAQALVNKGVRLSQLNRLEEELEVYDEVVRRFGASDSSEIIKLAVKALVYKGITLGQLNRSEEALEVYDEVVRRFGASDSSEIIKLVAQALMCKGVRLSQLDRSEEELGIYDEVVRRFGASDSSEIIKLVAKALMNKGITLGQLDRSEEELGIYDEVVRRFGASDSSEIIKLVAQALMNKGITLGQLDRSEEALGIYDEVVRRFGASDSSEIIKLVAKALVNKGVRLSQLDRSEEALGIYDEVVRRFGASDSSEIIKLAVKALMNKGVTLGQLNRSEEALEVYDEVVRRFGASDSSEIIKLVAQALMNKGITLGQLDRSEEALGIYDEVVRRFGASDSSEIIKLAVKALMNKGVTLGQLNRSEEALEVYDEVVRRFGASDSSEIIRLVVQALIGKGLTLGQLDLHDNEDVVRRFGDFSASERDLATILTILPRNDALEGFGIHALMVFSVHLGPKRAIELIQSSPAEEQLLPLVTALQQELGLKPRVAREVEEVAQDVREKMAMLRNASTFIRSEMGSA